MKTDGTDMAFSRPYSKASEYEAAATLGLTKREYFAAMALQGLCANPKFDTAPGEILSSWAVGTADALIEALNKDL